MILDINSLITLELFSGIKAMDGAELEENFFSYFSTEMDPLYSSCLAIRSIVGAFVEEVSDDIINQLILKYSILAEDLGMNCSLDDRWLRYASEWVTYSVSIIILHNTDEFKSASEGKIFKQLGDFSISRDNAGGNNSAIKELMEWLACEAFKYEHAIRSCSTPALNCEGLKNSKALPFEPKLAKLVEKGSEDINMLTPGRRWITDSSSPTGVRSNLFLWGKKYKSNIGGRSC